MEALDAEVAPGVPYPKILVEIREKAKARGALEPLHARRALRPRADQLGVRAALRGDGPQPGGGADGLQLLGAGHRQHGDPRRARHRRAAERWLEPLLEGRIRSCFSMTEPEVSGSDPTLLQARAVLDGDEWVIDGHKWFTSGAVGAELAIAMVVTDPDAHPYARASMICVPTDTPGFNLVRPIPVMGHDKGPGHCEIRYEDCRVPAANLLGERGAGFAIAQDRLGPGRIHHCMRAIGTAERALRDDVPPRQRARRLRRPAGRQAVRPGGDRRLADGDRPGPPADPLRRLEDGHRGQARRPPVDLGDQDRRRQHGHGRPRPRDPDPRLASA